INGNGELITCSEKENRDIFKSAQISLGALGIITRIKLRCIPAYKLELKNVRGNLKECLSNLEKYKKENRNFEFYHFPYTDVVQMKISNITENKPEKAGVMRYLNDMVIENGAFKVISEVSRIFPSQSKRMGQLCGFLVGESRRSTWSHQVYATARFVKFTEMEYNIPAENYVECMNEIVAKIEKEQYNLHFPIESRFVKGDDIYLSPAYQRDSAYVAVHMYKGMPFEKYLRDMEEIFNHYQGRPHWGKLHYKTSRELAELYPKWNDFHEIRKRMDPNGIFMNDYLESIF
ncbi:MAG: D-arabinono-1,4-lactone oxidase, partial [Saprospiraceae bacterium]